MKIIAEVIIGLVLGLNFNGLKFYGVKWGIVIQWSVVGFISGMLIIGFAEIIELLHKIAIN